MKYIIKIDNFKEIILKLIERLGVIEVKGDSVEHMFISRSMLKEIYQAIEIEEEIKDEVKEG